MANNPNNITVVGNITRDPEMKYTPSGAGQAILGIAVNRSWKNQQTDTWEERVSFFNVVCWKDLADNVSASLRKGMRVVVIGRLEQRSWETDSGEKRSVVEIVADEIAPSLLFATADVHRTERKTGDGGFNSGGKARPSARSGGYGDPGGEEPF